MFLITFINNNLKYYAIKNVEIKKLKILSKFVKYFKNQFYIILPQWYFFILYYLII